MCVIPGAYRHVTVAGSVCSCVIVAGVHMYDCWHA